MVSLDLSWNDYVSVEPISFDKLVRNLTKIVSVCIFWKRFINKWMYLTYMIAPKLIQRGSQPANAN
jgi:hypothetical protein